jgi:hypothetical protein
MTLLKEKKLENMINSPQQGSEKRPTIYTK